MEVHSRKTALNTRKQHVGLLIRTDKFLNFNASLNVENRLQLPTQLFYFTLLVVTISIRSL